MTDDSCIHWGTQVDFASGSTCEHGLIHFACKVAFLDGRVPETKAPHGAFGPSSPATASQEDGKVRPLAIRLGGGLLRFLGMCLIVVTGISVLIDALFGFSLSIQTLVTFSVGVGMHFLGRKITPGYVGVGASTGGAVMGVVVVGGFILLILWFFYMFITAMFG